MQTPAPMETPEDRARRLLVSAGWPADVALVSPPPPHPGEPEPTVSDPEAGGYYCGALRTRQQLAQDRENGVESPWPWCRVRAGYGTDHPRVGRCRNHGGNTPSGRTAARLRLAELVQPAMATLARALTDPDAPWTVKRQAASDILDRAGYPRRVDVDVDAQREGLVDRLWALADDEAPEGDDEEGED